MTLSAAIELIQQTRNLLLEEYEHDGEITVGRGYASLATPPQPKRVEPPPASLPVRAKRQAPPPKVKPVAPPLPPPPAVEPIVAETFSDVRPLVARALPHLRLSDTPPDDRSALSTKNKWVAEAVGSPIVILSCGEPPQQKAMLEKMAEALTKSVDGATVVRADAIEKAGEWDHFLTAEGMRMVVISETGLKAVPGLMERYKKPVNAPLPLVGEMPLFVLADLAIYLRQPQLKRGLWQTLISSYQNVKV